MYSKRLANREILRFIYAPPFTNDDDIFDEDKPDPPFPDAPFYMRSVYYYWWAFLRLNKEYMECCKNNGAGVHADLYRDFGDIREDDFFKWWIAKGRNLFCERDLYKIKTYMTVHEARDDPDHVLMSIPILKDMDHLVAEFRQLIKPLYRTRRRNNQLSTAKYPVHSNPIIGALYTRYKVYELREIYPIRTKTLNDIARMVGITASNEEQLKIRTSKALRESKIIIENVVLGKFPVLRLLPSNGDEI